MPDHKLSVEEFRIAFKAAGYSISQMARDVGHNVRTLQRRRASLEKSGLLAPSINNQQTATQFHWAYPRTRNLECQNGTIIVYSDAHYWPGIPPTLAFRALVKLCGDLRPFAIVANGDLIDGARISRFSMAGWSKEPGMMAELNELQARQAEIVAAAPKAKLFRSVGNHDIRLDRFFASNSEQFEGLPGTRLADFLPKWPESYSITINDKETLIKHRFRGGVHAAWNNVLQSGISTVTGHTHLLEAKAARGYRDARVWGIVTGTISENPIDGPEEGSGAFEYGEDNPSHWAAGFVVLTYYKGRLLPPEFCSVEFSKAWFRSQVVL